ncbi:altered inheritance of mitochondria protein 9, mitochondrial [Fusarium flagelliforme]|uniref:Altered inheritance of mitochondria protein 9, mitochondrial n=1 Tax=Fusarium flagelliforme TaxID=2675880 RepID=A0A395MBR9_9HYPO|nr:altered inheritance of mitochondria protein 9, mitochondrial [Fusarium flagelliforme]
MSDTARPGLLWDTSGLGDKPLWEYEPNLDDVAKVCQQALGLSSDECHVSFLASGAMNKAYTVRVNDEKRYVMRVSLPIDPKNKTASEVATLKWLHLNNPNVPVPEVIAFDDCNNNPIRFEWILMQHMPGQPLSDKWRKIPWEDKIALVKQIADCQMEIMKNYNFEGIGSLRETEKGIVPDRYVAMDFCFGKSFDCDVPRGPFRCIRDWTKSLTEIITQHYIDAIKKAEEDGDDEYDKDDLEYFEAYLKTTKRLANTIQQVFPDEYESTVLQHADLILSNIMVDENNKLCGIIDWEFASTVPLWAVNPATQIPKFLDGHEQEELPDRDAHGPAEPDYEGGGGLDDEGKASSYWESLMDYETTQLRKVYKDYVGQRLCPSAMRDHEDSAMKIRVDFLEAINWCRIGLLSGKIEDWLDEIEKGNFIRL